jgi:peptidoglycan/xylan/chitin deacetylase (PgdA/CDA1 family)
MPPFATILLYRDVRLPTRDCASLTALTPAQLGAQLDRLTAARRPVVPMATLRAALAGHTVLPDGAVVLTFDGGLADHHDLALPQLLQRGMVGTFHLPVTPITEGRVTDGRKIRSVLAAANSEQDVIAAVFDLVAEHRRTGAALPHGQSLWDELALTGNQGNREMMFVTRLLRSGLPAAVRSDVIGQLFRTFVTSDEQAYAAALYLPLEKARALIAAGMDVGGQGATTTNLQGLPRPFQEAEVAESAKFLTHVMGLPAGNLSFAYPHGGWDEVTLELLPAYGFASGATNHKGIIRRDSDPYRLPRWDGTRNFEAAIFGA